MNKHKNKSGSKFSLQRENGARALSPGFSAGEEEFLKIGANLIKAGGHRRLLYGPGKCIESVQKGNDHLSPLSDMEGAVTLLLTSVGTE